MFPIFASLKNSLSCSGSLKKFNFNYDDDNSDDAYFDSNVNIIKKSSNKAKLKTKSKLKKSTSSLSNANRSFNFDNVSHISDYDNTNNKKFISEFDLNSNTNMLNQSSTSLTLSKYDSKAKRKSVFNIFRKILFLGMSKYFFSIKWGVYS